jgi:murein DD-endopeptidase MepM/ murein hydrolase activator NlpD
LFIPLWLINYFKKNSFKKSVWIVVIGNFVVIGGLVTIPKLVSAGLFSSSVQAFNIRSESLQTLPILESKMSPMNLRAVGGPEPITDEDSLTSPFSLYDSEDVVIPERDTISTYVVQAGDSLSEIADRYGVSSNTIRWANNIPAKTGIKVGQNLLILPITGIRHKVAKGDTLASIAKRYKSDADDIASFNGLESGEKLTAGEYIIVPDGEMNIPTEQIKTKTVKVSTTSSNKSSSSDTQQVSGGYYSKPVIGGILTQGYHDRYHALDISLPRGQAMGAPILAAAPGTVIVAKSSGFNGGYGEMVIIQHDNGTQTLYAHLSSVKVSVGDQVNRGQVIGGMGSTGRSTGPHLHFEVRGDKTPMMGYTRR